MIELMCGDFRVEAEKIPAGSVDLVLTDLPYGTIKGLNSGNWKDIDTSWDNAVPPKEVHEIINRVLRENGAAVLTCQEPYTSDLKNGAIPNLLFCYRMIWKKDHFANALMCNKAPVSLYEDILVFRKKHPIHDDEMNHPLRPYFKKVYEFIGGTKKEIIGTIGSKADHTFRFNSSQFALCTKEAYRELTEEYLIDCMEDFEALEALEVPFTQGLRRERKETHPAVVNLWRGGKYKSNILEYSKDYTGLNPTQKPLKLMEDLVQTYSNPGDTVLDLTMGSGTTAVACVNTDRRFIGIEIREQQFQEAKNRIEEAEMMG